MLLLYFLSRHFIYKLLDRPLHLQRHPLVKDIKEETIDDVFQATSGTSTKTTTTPIHNQQYSNKYENKFIYF